MPKTAPRGRLYEIRWMKAGDPLGSDRLLGKTLGLVAARNMRDRWRSAAPDVSDCWIVDAATKKRVG